MTDEELLLNMLADTVPTTQYARVRADADFVGHRNFINYPGYYAALEQSLWWKVVELRYRRVEVL